MQAIKIEKDPSLTSRHPSLTIQPPSGIRVALPFEMVRFMLNAFYKAAVEPCFKKPKNNQDEDKSVLSADLSAKKAIAGLEIRSGLADLESATDNPSSAGEEQQVLVINPVRVIGFSRPVFATEQTVHLTVNSLPRLDAKSIPLTVLPSQLAFILQKLQKIKIIVSKSISKATLGVMTLTISTMFLVRELHTLLVSELMGYDPQHVQLLSSISSDCATYYAKANITGDPCLVDPSTFEARCWAEYPNGAPYSLIQECIDDLMACIAADCPVPPPPPPVSDSSGPNYDFLYLLLLLFPIGVIAWCAITSKKEARHATQNVVGFAFDAAKSVQPPLPVEAGPLPMPMGVGQAGEGEDAENHDVDGGSNYRALNGSDDNPGLEFPGM